MRVDSLHGATPRSHRDTQRRKKSKLLASVSSPFAGYDNEKTIEILDLVGKVLVKERTTRNNTAMPIGKLPGGLYVVKVTAKDGTAVSRDKFVKE